MTTFMRICLILWWVMTAIGVFRMMRSLVISIKREHASWWRHMLCGLQMEYPPYPPRSLEPGAPISIIIYWILSFILIVFKH